MTVVGMWVPAIVGILAFIGCDEGTGSPSGPPEFAEALSTAVGPGSHEPAGYTRFAEHSFEALPPAGPPGTCSAAGILDGCWFTYDPEANISLDSVADAPVSAPGVLQIRYPTGLTPGASPGLFHGWDTGSGSCSTEYRSIYESGWVRVPTADFEMNAVGVKFLGYIRVGRNCDDRVASQIYFLSDNTPHTGEKEIRTATNLNVIQQGVADRRMEQNVTTGLVFTFGEWHHYEYLMELNDLGFANGTLKVWWDGQLIMEYTDVMWRTLVDPSGFYGRHWDPIWGGRGGTAKSRDDFLQVEHIYISGIACDPAMGCS